MIGAILGFLLPFYFLCFLYYALTTISFSWFSYSLQLHFLYPWQIFSFFQKTLSA